MPKKYEAVLNDILDKINNGQYKLDSLLPTEKYFTDYYNVSRITVQKAMNILVQEGVIERIAGKGSFVKKVPTGSGETGSKNMYAIVLPFQELETLTIIKGVQEVLDEKNNYLTVHFTEYDNLKEIEIIKKLLDNNINNIIFYPLYSNLSVDFCKKIIQDGANIVFIDKEMTDFHADAVLADNFDGSYKATKFMIEKGHRNIAYLTYSYNWGTSLLERTNGFKKCMSDNGLWNENVIVRSDITCQQDVPSVLSDVLESDKDLTAIMCSTDALAKEVLYYLKSHNYSVPDDISLMGFDNSIIAQTVRPKLATVSQDFLEIGRCAARLLIYKEKNPSANLHKILIPTKVVDRASVKNLCTDTSPV